MRPAPLRARRAAAAFALRVITAAALLLSCGRAGPPPDVVIITIDTLRPDHLDAYGYDRPTAPFLAELAADAALFDRAVTAASYTAPSTASLFTSLYPPQHGVIEGLHAKRDRIDEIEEGEAEVIPVNRLPDNIPTLPEYFRERGYRTFGIAANPNICEEVGFDRGFDHFALIRQGDCRDVFARLKEWKELIEPGAPNLFYLHFNDAHRPYHKRPPWYEPSGEAVGDSIAAYNSEIRYLDETLRDMFAEFGWGGETVVAVVSDHGEEFLEHGKLGHWYSLYPELTRIVMMVRAPRLGVVPGRVGAGCSNVDLLPTLAELTGGEADGLWEGRSQAKLLTRRQGRGASDGPERPLFSHRARSKGAPGALWSVVERVADREWLLIRQRKSLELYDLDRDPFARRSVLDDHPEVAARLDSTVGAFRERAKPVGDATGEYVLDKESVDELRSLGYVR